MVCCELLQPLVVHANNSSTLSAVCALAKVVEPFRPFGKLRTTPRIREATFPHPREGAARTRGYPGLWLRSMDPRRWRMVSRLLQPLLVRLSKVYIGQWFVVRFCG